MVVVTVDVSALRARVQQFAADVMDDALDAMPEQMRGYAPIGTGPDAGALRASIVRDRVDGGGGDTVRGRIIAPVIQAQTTDQGSPPHLILPRKVGGLLVFEASDGTTVFTTRVNHPGNPPRPWWERALRSTFGPALRFAAIGRSTR